MVAQLYIGLRASGEAAIIAALQAELLMNQLRVHLVDWHTKQILSGPRRGGDLRDINPKGNEPTLVLDDGTILNEGAAVLQWIADQNPESGLMPPWGSSQRYLVQCKLNYFASKLHAYCAYLYQTRVAQDSPARTGMLEKLKAELDFLNQHAFAGGKKYLVGESFTAADAYLWVILSWLKEIELDLKDYDALKAYFDRVDMMDVTTSAVEYVGLLAADSGQEEAMLSAVKHPALQQRRASA